MRWLLSTRKPSDFRYLLFGLTTLPLLVGLLAGEDGSTLTQTRTMLHYFFAIASTLIFIGLIPVLFGTEPHDRWTLFSRVFLFTGIIGMLLLSGIQWLAAKAETGRLYGDADASFLWHLGRIIAFSYRSAEDPNANFFISLVGFTFGVGLCEELVKIIPVWFMLDKGETGWNKALVVGLVSGVAFGVAEGVYYSEHFYNGSAPFILYLIRFVSCVGSHAVYTGAAALNIERREAMILRGDFVRHLMMVLFYLLPVMFLHGLYDTFLKMNMPGWAVVSDFAAFGWLIVQVEISRQAEFPRRSSDALRKRKPVPLDAQFVQQQAVVDQLHSKISHRGIASLTKSERQFLESVSRQRARTKPQS